MWFWRGGSGCEGLWGCCTCKQVVRASQVALKSVSLRGGGGGYFTCKTYIPAELDHCALTIPTCWYPKSLVNQMQSITDPTRTIADSTQTVVDPMQASGISFEVDMRGLGSRWISRFHVVSFLFALGTQHERLFWWNTGLCFSSSIVK